MNKEINRLFCLYINYNIFFSFFNLTFTFNLIYNHYFNKNISSLTNYGN